MAKYEINKVINGRKYKKTFNVTVEVNAEKFDSVEDMPKEYREKIGYNIVRGLQQMHIENKDKNFPDMTWREYSKHMLKLAGIEEEENDECIHSN